VRVTEKTYKDVVYYESRKGELQTRPIYECRCDERLKAQSEKSTHLVYTGFLGELEHLKIKTRINIVVYYESRKGEIKTRPIYECRCDERLKTKSEKSTYSINEGRCDERLKACFIILL
jgi:hypothetical protein